MKTCPTCKEEYEEHPAISRRDNKTEICPDCGTREALEDFNNHNNPKLRVWWNSDFGKPAFNRDVRSVAEAKEILKVLTAYDLYLGDKVVANAGGLEVFEDGEWSEYYDEKTGEDIMEMIDNEAE